MAEWIKQVFYSDGCEITLEVDHIQVLGQGGPPGFTYLPARLEPHTKESSHRLAMMLRKAARRMEEIGKGLPNGSE